MAGSGKPKKAKKRKKAKKPTISKTGTWSQNREPEWAWEDGKGMMSQPMTLAFLQQAAAMQEFLDAVSDLKDRVAGEYAHDPDADPAAVQQQKDIRAAMKRVEKAILKDQEVRGRLHACVDDFGGMDILKGDARDADCEEIAVMRMIYNGDYLQMPDIWGLE